jgi:hypothetical protein
MWYVPEQDNSEQNKTTIVPSAPTPAKIIEKFDKQYRGKQDYRIFY